MKRHPRPQTTGPIVILRHSITSWNEERRWQGGEIDLPLSLSGRRHAIELADRLRRLGIDEEFTIVTSPMKRAIETAEILKNCMQVRADIVNIDILREAYIGELSGLTEQDVFQRFPKIFSEWSSGKTSSFPGGESQSDMTERARNALKIVAEICSPTLVVTHRTLLTAMRGIVGLPDATPATHDYGMISPDPGDCIDKREWRNLFPNAADLGE